MDIETWGAHVKVRLAVGLKGHFFNCELSQRKLKGVIHEKFGPALKHNVSMEEGVPPTLVVRRRASFARMLGRRLSELRGKRCIYWIKGYSE